RDYHALTRAGDWRMDVQPIAHGLRVTAFAGATPLYLLAPLAQVIPHHEWHRGYLLAQEAYRGLDALDDNLYAGEFSVLLHPGESLTLVASTEPAPNLDGHAAYAVRQEHEQALLAASPQANAPAWVRQLVLAADQFIVQRATPDDRDGRSVIAGYPWFGDWGRDTMIALPGLALATGRHALAASILRTFAQFVDRGMLPNRFPDAGETPEYNTVDATLWYFEAIRAYVAATGDESLLRDLFPVLQEIVAWHQRGARYGIRMDADGLLAAGEEGVQLTWMDAKVGDWVVTPRTGKPVEINALWYNALRNMAAFARRLGLPGEEYDALATQSRTGFARFWYAAGGYCYDVIDGPAGDDPSLRPNQLLAVSLPHSPLTPEQQRSVVDVCARRLLTSYGLRSLAPDDPAYRGHYGGGPQERDGAYHQGAVWSWLMGPFVSAHLRVHGDRAAALNFLAPFAHHLADHGLGSISEIFDGDPPHTPRGCIAQAWGVAELLRVWNEMVGEG
ncbi:MAG: glycogen debranching protein, partial [Caldilineae bacterium]